VRPVVDKHYMTPAQLDAMDAARNGTRPAFAVPGRAESGTGWPVLAAWVAVGIPIAWGVWVTLQKAAILFGV